MSETAAALHPDTHAAETRWGVRLAAWLEAERERWALWVPVGFGTGVGLYFALDHEPAAWLGAACVGLAGLAAILSRGRPIVLLLALAVAVVSAGFAAAQLRSLMVAAPVLEARLGPIVLRGRVIAVEPRAKGWRLTLRDLQITSLDAVSLPVRVRVSGFGDLGGARPGDRVRLRAVLRPPPEPAAPGAFDFARRAYFQGLGAVGTARGGVTVLDRDTTAGSRREEDALPGLSALWWTRLRYQIAGRVLRAVPGEAGAVAAALMTGESSGIISVSSSISYLKSFPPVSEVFHFSFGRRSPKR